MSDDKTVPSGHSRMIVFVISQQQWLPTEDQHKIKVVFFCGIEGRGSHKPQT